MWSLDPSAVIVHSLILCVLGVLNLATWSYIVYQFWQDHKEGHRQGFFPVVFLMVVGYMLLAAGTLITRLLNVTRFYSLTPGVKEVHVSLLAHILQEVLLIVMLITSVAILHIIKKRREGD